MLTSQGRIRRTGSIIGQMIALPSGDISERIGPRLVRPRVGSITFGQDFPQPATG
jgi:hypothetical protein